MCTLTLYTQQWISCDTVTLYTPQYMLCDTVTLYIPGLWLQSQPVYTMQDL